MFKRWRKPNMQIKSTTAPFGFADKLRIIR